MSLRVMSRWRKNGRLVRGRFFLMYFHFGNQNCWRYRRNRNGTGFGATISVENIRCIAGGHYFRQRDERRSNDIDAANQLIGTAVREDFVNNQRQHLKRLWLGAAGESEAAGNIVNQQAKRFSLLFHKFNQLASQLR